MGSEMCIRDRSVNDPYVMNGWGEINNTTGKIKMLSDPYLLFTKAIGAEVDRNAKGLSLIHI